MRKQNRLRRAAVLCLAGLLLTLGTLPAAALTPSYTPSSAYRASTYYQNLKELPVTGDTHFDVVSIALTQLAYHEGNGSAHFGGASTGSGNFTEYNYYLGKVGGTYGYAWCAAFVSWCLDMAGAKDSAGGKFASCTLWVEKLQTLGQYRTRASGYTPKEGDLIFFRSAGVTRASDHVGLVRYVKNGRVYTVEGNASNQVMLRDYALKDTYIVGYGLPAYAGSSLQIDRAAVEDGTTGYYVVSYTFVNVRASRSASASKYGSLQKGKLVQVSEIKNGWGRIEYNGKVGYISLEYADFVTPLSHTVRYVSEGKTLHEARYFSTTYHAVSTLSPEREGYEFLHWSDASGKIYRAGEKMPAGDGVLSAVFQALPEVPDEVLPPTEVGGESGDTPIWETPSSPQLDGAPPTVLPDTAQTALAARRHAGVVSGVLALTLGGVWLALRRREET